MADWYTFVHVVRVPGFDGEPDRQIGVLFQVSHSAPETTWKPLDNPHLSRFDIAVIDAVARGFAETIPPLLNARLRTTPALIIPR